MSAPCYKCENRKPSCHDTCEVYKNWKSVNEQKKEHVRSATTDYDNFHIDNIVRFKRRNGIK